MKIINNTYKDEQFNYKPFDSYFKDMNFAIFDIETTGLSPKKAQLILSGFVIPNGDGTFTSKQIFAESLEEEPEVIAETLKVLADFDFIVTYNGASFDVPFLEKRMKYQGFSDVFMPYNLDLYKIVRNFSDIGKFTPNLKQKTLESYMGLWHDRDDEIDGKASIDLYYYFLSTGDLEAEEKILLHNSDDVAQLYRLLNALRQSDLHRAMCSCGFPIDNGQVTEIKINKSRLSVVGIQGSSPINYVEYNDDLGLKTIWKKDQFQIELALLHENIDNGKHGNLIFYDLDLFKEDDKYFDDSYFQNCEGMTSHYLVLANDGVANHLAITTLIKYLINRIYKLLNS